MFGRRPSRSRALPFGDGVQSADALFGVCVGVRRQGTVPGVFDHVLDKRRQSAVLDAQTPADAMQIEKKLRKKKKRRRKIRVLYIIPVYQQGRASQ